MCLFGRRASSDKSNLGKGVKSQIIPMYQSIVISVVVTIMASRGKQIYLIPSSLP
jgi:hypothetical protein